MSIRKVIETPDSIVLPLQREFAVKRKELGRAKEELMEKQCQLSDKEQEVQRIEMELLELADWLTEHCQAYEDWRVEYGLAPRGFPSNLD
jgi:hypothetical protein